MMKALTIIFIYSFFIFNEEIVAKDTKSLEDFYINGKRFVWQGSKDLNHFYYDFNGDQKIDAFDVQVSSGVDYYSNRVNGEYLNKLSVRKSGNGIVEKNQVKEAGQWKEIGSSYHSLINREIASNKCQKVDKNLLINTYEKAVLCLLDPQKGGHVGNSLIQKITSNLRGDSYDVDILNYKGKVKEFECISDTNAYNCTLSLNDLDDSISSKEIFHYYMHLAGLHHVISKVDVVYACTQCCLSDNQAACKVCSQKDSLGLKDDSFQLDILSLFVYEDYITKDKIFPQYHNALIRVHNNLDHKNLIKTLLSNLDWNKDQIIEKLYSQFQKHLELGVNELSNEQLYFSDMLAEIMAKVACTDFSKDINSIVDDLTKKCEIMYLARSLPSSLCYHQLNKKTCKEQYLKNYVIRKEQHRKGIRLPSNFTSLN